jgi:hypothetical protein
MKYYSKTTKGLCSIATPVSIITVGCIFIAIWVPTDFLQQRFGWSAVLLIVLAAIFWVSAWFSMIEDNSHQKELKKEYDIEHGTQDRQRYNEGGIVH